MSSFTHFDAKGNARMVDVSEKQITERSATARASVFMQAETLQLILSGGVKKGDVLQVARLAGIMAAKRTAEPFWQHAALTTSGKSAKPKRAAVGGVLLAVAAGSPTDTRLGVHYVKCWKHY